MKQFLIAALFIHVQAEMPGSVEFPPPRTSRWVLTEVSLNDNQALSDAWKAAAEIAGLLQREDFP
jgi:hypothetical protein